MMGKRCGMENPTKKISCVANCGRISASLDCSVKYTTLGQGKCVEVFQSH